MIWDLKCMSLKASNLAMMPPIVISAVTSCSEPVLVTCVQLAVQLAVAVDRHKFSSWPQKRLRLINKNILSKREATLRDLDVKYKAIEANITRLFMKRGGYQCASPYKSISLVPKAPGFCASAIFY
jgi:hypothetical protein